MKVLLIQPSFSFYTKKFPPLGLGYLASCLGQSGHKIKIIYSTVSKLRDNEVQKEIKIFGPDVVGINATTLNFFDALAIARYVKEYNPNCLTVLGGPHPTVRARETLKKYSDIDVVVRGEGEKTFTDLLENVRKKNFRTVRGISFRLNGKVIENMDRHPIENLDTIPFPAYDLLPMNEYKTQSNFFRSLLLEKHGQSFGTIMSSRGCPYGCSFCASCTLWGKKWRARSPENVVEELKILREKYGKKLIDILDDSFSLDKKRVLNICRMIKNEQVDISWKCTTRVDLFDREIATAIKEAGCEHITFGIDSGVQQTLDFLHKGHSVEDSILAVKKAKKTGLKVESNFIIGVPGETKETINQTISFAKKLNLDYTSFTLLTPYPGTKIYDYAEKNNLIITKDWSKYNLIGSVMNVPGFTTRELQGFLLKIFLIFRLNPSVSFQSIAKKISSETIVKKNKKV